MSPTRSTILVTFITLLALNPLSTQGQALTERSANLRGGWSLTAYNDTVCPTDAPMCGSSWCCPSSLTCVTTGGSALPEVCCPGTDECINDFTSARTAVCADNTWNLWNSTTAGYPSNYFCCLPGQIGLQNGECVLPSELAASGSSQAVLVSGTPVSGVSGSASIPSSTSTSISVLGGKTTSIKATSSPAISNATPKNTPTGTLGFTLSASFSHSTSSPTATGTSDAASLGLASSSAKLVVSILSVVGMALLF